MKKNLLLFLNFLFLLNTLFSQAPEIEWQNTIGGSNDDYPWTISGTSDGGSIVAGWSFSGISFDKTDSLIGINDYWVVRLDNYGEIVWQKTIGGLSSEAVFDIQETSDGGFILGGVTKSGISGNKTEINNGLNDIWIVRLSDSGEIIWQNTIGGSLDDHFLKLDQTSDGGYILGCVSKSEISGDKTEMCRGDYDYWIIKLNDTGLIEWQRTLGGSGKDWISSIEQTIDNGFIVCGYSASGITGEKSESSQGGDDYWIIKLGPSGLIDWQNTIGGSSLDQATEIIQCDDNGYLVVGISSSGISGDKTDPNKTVGAFLKNDYWVIKLNEAGNIDWQKTIGGSGDDFVYSVVKGSFGGYVLGGSSNSMASVDKSENVIGGITMYDDFWIVGINNLGEIVWENTIGGNGYDHLTQIYRNIVEGFIILTGFSSSNVSGNKSENNLGAGGDYWVIKLSPDCTPSPELCNSLDDNCNGLIDDAITETISISAGGPITFCQGGNVLLTATYSGASVQWKKNGVNIPGATSPTYLVTTKATYTCVTTSPCGTATSTGIFVNVNKNPAASITAGGATTFCAGGSVVLTANAGGGLSYQWYKGASLIAGATSINYTATLAGNYKCRVTKTATGCFKNSNVITVTVPCKEGEMVDVENAFNIYPNPNDGTFTIEAIVKTQDFASPESTIEIYNNLGQIIFSKEINSNDGIINETIEIKNIIPGIYLIKLWNNNIQNVKNIIIN